MSGRLGAGRENTRRYQQHSLAALVPANESIMFTFCWPLEILWQKFHLWSSPVVFPFYRTYGVLRQPSAACKVL